jgi:hypothetical protein
MLVRMARVEAEALGVRDGYLEPLSEVAADEIAQATACMVRKNAESFGRAFHDHFKRNSFEFPGNPNGLAEGFTTPLPVIYSRHVGIKLNEIAELRAQYGVPPVSDPSLLV